MAWKQDEELLRFIESYWSERGFAPSYREIGDAVGYSSPASVRQRLARMRRDGLVEFEDRIPRTVRLA